MRSFLLFLLFLAVFAPSARAGDPRLVRSTPVETFRAPVQLVTAASGRMFIAYREDAFPLGDLVIEVSDDNGLNWSEWYRDVDVSLYQLAIVPTATGNELGLLYDDDEDEEIRFARTDPDLAVPSWTEFTIVNYDVGPGAFPRLPSLDLSVRPNAGSSATVAAAYLLEVDSDDYETYYALSTDGGATFSAPTLQQSTTLADFGGVEIAVGLGGGGRAYLALLEETGSASSGSMLVERQVALSSGAGIWGPWSTVFADTTNQGAGDLSLAVDPGSTDVVLAFHQGQTRIFGSISGGNTFLEAAVQDADDMDEPHAVWTDLGFRVTAQRRIGPDPKGHHVFEPVVGITSNFSHRLIMKWIYGTGPGGQAMVSSHPSFPGELAVVGLCDQSFSDDGVFFAADWQDTPGIGVSEANSPIDGFTPFTSAPAIVDVNGNGFGDILITAGSQLRAYEVSTGSSATATLTDVTDLASAAVAVDVGGSTNLEVFTSSADGQLHGFASNLSVLAGWPVQLPTASTSWLSGGAVSGFLPGEVVYANGPHVGVLGGDGRMRPGWPKDFGSNLTVGPVALGDVDNDGLTNVVVALDEGVFIFEGTGELENIFNYTGIGVSFGVSLRDLDGDGDLEIGVPHSDGRVSLQHHDGSSFGPNWPFDTAKVSPIQGIVFTNLEAFGSEGILFNNQQGNSFALDISATPYAGWPVTLTTPLSGSLVTSRVVRPNITRPQAIYGGDDGFSHVIRYDGASPVAFPRYVSLEATLPAAVNDLDNDGFNEMVLAGDESLWVIDMGTTPLGASRRWPMQSNDAGRRSCHQCAPVTATSVPGELPVVSAASFAGAFPNPSRGLTSLQFSLPRESRVQLDVFDVRGRRVRQLRNEVLPAGLHSVEWDGRDQEGTSVAGGNYFGRLQLENGDVREVLVRKLTVTP